MMGWGHSPCATVTSKISSSFSMRSTTSWFVLLSSATSTLTLSPFLLASAATRSTVAIRLSATSTGADAKYGALSPTNRGPESPPGPNAVEPVELGARVVDVASDAFLSCGMPLSSLPRRD